MGTKMKRAPGHREQRPQRAFPFDGKAASAWLRGELRDAELADRLIRVAAQGDRLSAYLRRTRAASTTARRTAALLAKARARMTSPTHDEQVGTDLQSAYLLAAPDLLRRTHVADALLPRALTAMRKAEEFLSRWDGAMPPALIDGRLLFDRSTVAAALAHDDAVDLGVKLNPSRLLAIIVAVGIEGPIESQADFDKRRDGWKKKVAAMRRATMLLRQLRSR